MIAFAEVYAWLNYCDVSHLGPASQLSIIQINDKKIPKNHREAIKKSLRVSCETCIDDLETLEIKLALAQIDFQEDDFIMAKITLAEAVEGYKKSSHRRAIADWLMGICLMKCQETEAGYQCWRKARENFDGQIKLFRKLKDGAENDRWYTQKRDLLFVDMACTAEEAYAWLTLIEPSHLTASARLLTDEIKNKISRKQYPLAYEIGSQLSKVSRNRLDSVETAEAWVIIGLAAYQMGNPRAAVDYWLRASASYAPLGHGQAIARWMMGIAQWQIPSETTNAIKNWRDVLETFNHLKEKAVRENHVEDRNWYEMWGEIMRKANERTIKEKMLKP
jgi:tetratricopeptide (TPR) repeat protein